MPVPPHANVSQAGVPTYCYMLLRDAITQCMPGLPPLAPYPLLPVLAAGKGWCKQCRAARTCCACITHFLDMQAEPM